jgi:hypothetical protein
VCVYPQIGRQCCHYTNTFGIKQPTNACATHKSGAVEGINYLKKIMEPCKEGKAGAYRVFPLSRDETVLPRSSSLHFALSTQTFMAMLPR